MDLEKTQSLKTPEKKQKSTKIEIEMDKDGLKKFEEPKQQGTPDLEAANVPPSSPVPAPAPLQASPDPLLLQQQMLHETAPEYFCCGKCMHVKVAVSLIGAIHTFLLTVLFVAVLKLFEYMFLNKYIISVASNHLLFLLFIAFFLYLSILYIPLICLFHGIYYKNGSSLMVYVFFGILEVLVTVAFDVIFIYYYIHGQVLILAGMAAFSLAFMFVRMWWAYNVYKCREYYNRLKN